MSDERRPLPPQSGKDATAISRAVPSQRRATQTVQRAADNWSEGLTSEASVHLLMPERKHIPFFLRQLTGPGAPHDWNFTKERSVIGRSKTADFSIDSPELSRRHLAILRDGKSFKCVDLQSRNGIYLDGVRVHSLILRHGDVIQLGNVSFLFCEGV